MRLVLGAIVVFIVLGFSIWIGPTLWAGRAIPVFLSEHLETLGFDSGTTDDWKPLEHNPGWMAYDKAGDIDVTSLAGSRCGNQTGQFLKYPLRLKSESGGYKSRNAIYRPTDGAKIAGIIANVCYTSDPGFGGETIIGGFIAEDKTTIHESDTRRLDPNTWNTLVWSMDSPHFWASDGQKDAKWQTLRETFPFNERGDLFVYQWLDNTGVDRIGIQFYVWTDSSSRESEVSAKEFRGTAYFDNIVVLYSIHEGFYADGRSVTSIGCSC
jgi:hypothetical protein